MADAKIIRLPTAAKHRVRQPPHNVRRVLAAQVDEHPADYMAPWVRGLMRDRERLQGTAAEAMRDSAALLIAYAILAHADPVLKAKVYGSVCQLDLMYRTPETTKAVLLVEPMLKAFKGPPGAA